MHNLRNIKYVRLSQKTDRKPGYFYKYIWLTCKFRASKVIFHKMPCFLNLQELSVSFGVDGVFCLFGIPFVSFWSKFHVTFCVFAFVFGMSSSFPVLIVPLQTRLFCRRPFKVLPVLIGEFIPYRFSLGTTWLLLVFELDWPFLALIGMNILINSK
jgi:hypothetical protein